MTRQSLDLVHGTVDLLVLRTLAWDTMHGYAIAQFVKQRTNGAIVLESAALYQALRRLEKRRLVRGSWGVTETGRRARFYDLTDAGKAELQTQAKDIRDYMAALSRVLDAR